MAEAKKQQARAATKAPANQPFNLKGAVGGKKKMSRWKGYDTAPRKKEKDED